MNTWLDRNRSVVLAALAAVIVVGLVILALQRRDGPRPLEIRFDDPAANGTAIQVYVTGAVHAPGVYSLPDSDRIGDALDTAGGAADDANLASINLAQRLRDQDEVLVPHRGETKVDGVSTPAAGQKIDINSATAQALDALPGIGEVYSQRIVESRNAEGPFHRPEELVERQVLPQSTYDKIKDLITVVP